MALLRSFARDTTAVTAIEYALIVALIAVAGLAAFPLVAAAMNAMFGKASTAIGS